MIHLKPIFTRKKKDFVNDFKPHFHMDLMFLLRKDTVHCSLQ